MANIPPEERLTNLVVALMATDHGLTKQQILESVSGYRQRSEAGARADALEKMFERDKDELRRLGIPLDTLGDFADPTDLREARYRIPRTEYDLPDDLEFTPEELAVLRLAASVWSAGSMSDDAQAGVRKIRALGIDGDEPTIGFAPRIVVRSDGFVPVQDAIERCVAVRFAYLKPGDEHPRERVLLPLALVEYEARWHVFGIDTRIDADRIFLLSRIVGDVQITTQTFDAALKTGAAERALQGLREVAARSSASLQVTPGTEAAVRLGRRATPDGSGIRVPYVDREIFADELASFGPEVRVVAPDDLRAAVIARLRAVVAAHPEAS